MSESFIKGFTDYLKTRTDAPPDWHLHAALVCMATAIGTGVHTAGRGDVIYPNIFVVNIGRSGMGKSVPLALAARLLHKAGFGGRVYDTAFTYEALIKRMVDQPTGVFIAQEFAAFLEMIGRDYNRGTIEFLTDAFDTPPAVSRSLMQHRYEVLRPAPSLLGASSPAWFAEQFKRAQLEGGFFSRFIFSPQTRPGPYVEDPGPLNAAIETALADHLRILDEVAGVGDFTAVRAKLREWDRERRRGLAAVRPELAGMASRAELLVKKTAMLFHASHDPYTHRIDDRDLDNAIAYVEHSHAQADRYLLEEVAHDKDDADVLRVLEIVRRRGGTDVLRSFVLTDGHLSADRANRAERTLVESGRLWVRQDRKAKLYSVTPPAGTNGVHEAAIYGRES